MTEPAHEVADVQNCQSKLWRKEQPDLILDTNGYPPACYYLDCRCTVVLVGEGWVFGQGGRCQNKAPEHKDRFAECDQFPGYPSIIDESLFWACDFHPKTMFHPIQHTEVESELHCQRWVRNSHPI